MTTEITLKWHIEDGVQVYDNGDPVLHDWLTTPAQCPQCKHVQQVVVAVDSAGFECVVCGYVDPFFVWGIPDNAQDNRRASC